MKRMCFFALCALNVCLLTPLAVAADDQGKPPDVSETWIIVPQPGHTEEFYATFQEHLKFRTSKGDPRVWKTFAPVIGDDLGFYATRTCCSQWADLDAYARWEADNGIQEHWNANVHPHVASYRHHLSVIDFANSRWPTDTGAYRFFGVAEFQLKMGRGQAIQASLTEMSKAAKDGGWPRYWTWATDIGGPGSLTLVAPFKSYADMAPPEESFPAFLAGQLGSPEKAAHVMSSFTEGLQGSSYTVYELIDVLSMPDP